MVDRPNWTNGGAGGDGAAPNASPPAAVPPGRQVAHSDWNYTPMGLATDLSAEANKSQEPVVAGVGYAQSLVEKFSRQPEGFEANDARLVNATVDLLERPDTPKDLEAAFDKLPVSLQTKAYEVLWANPSASLEQIYAKLKGKLTLSEAAEAAKAMAALELRRD